MSFGSTKDFSTVAPNDSSTPFSENAVVIPHCRSMEGAVEVIQNVVELLDEKYGAED